MTRLSMSIRLDDFSSEMHNWFCSTCDLVIQIADDLNSSMVKLLRHVMDINGLLGRLWPSEISRSMYWCRNHYHCEKLREGNLSLTFNTSATCYPAFSVIAPVNLLSKFPLDQVFEANIGSPTDAC